MSELHNHLLLKTTDNATENVAIFGGLRVSVITEQMFRVEYGKCGEFCDLATQKVLHRNFANPKYEISQNGELIVVKTEAVQVTVDTKGNFKSVIFADGRVVVNPKCQNLKGTCRTLDGTVGAVKLEDGILSKNGVAIMDDSNSLVYNNEGELCQKPVENRDYYIFAYGFDYRRAVADFYKLSGETPLIPRYVLGNWWSRYRAYTEKEYLDLMDNFIKKNIPITVATVDMDWHLVHGIDKKYRTGNIFPWESTGWTGYTWNDKLFPDYRRFLTELRARNLHVTLNLHPARGVRGYEAMYKDMATAMGVDYKTEQPIDFDMGNAKFVNNYFDILHHPYEKDGVDFWWIDWQQGRKSKMQGLDPLYALNHYHTLDNGRADKRGLILSRYAGIGSHRYPLGFSGDTSTSWKCLKFQPYFTANASNCGYTWWSHDIGGHHFGRKDDELYCRWIQFGVFSPIMRLHSTQNDIMGKEPWNYSSVTEDIVSEYLRLRHKMIPYLYTMNMRTHRNGLALIEPLYYEYPQDERAYECKNTYLFGGNLLVAPITQRTDKTTLTASAKVFLPKGRWTDIFTNAVYEGDSVFEVNRDIKNIPVFAKEGTIIPLSDDEGNSSKNPAQMRLWVYSGNGEFNLYEDDGESYNYQKGQFAERKFTVAESGNDIIFDIAEVIGDSSICADRKFIVDFKDIARCENVIVQVNGKEVDCKVANNGYVQCEISLSPSDNLKIKLENFRRISNGTINENIVRIFARYQGRNDIKSRLYNPFKNVNSKEDLKRTINKSALCGSRKKLRSELEELLHMQF